LPEVSFAEQRELLARLVGFVMGVFQPHSGDTPPSSLADYFAALDRRDYFIRNWEHFFTTWDVLLCPVAMTTAFPHRATGTPLNVDGETVRYWEEISHCTPSSLTGHPAAVIPRGQDREGLPIGVQVVGRRWDDEQLLAIAKVLTEVTVGYQKPPGHGCDAGGPIRRSLMASGGAGKFMPVPPSITLNPRTIMRPCSDFLRTSRCCNQEATG